MNRTITETHNVYSPTSDQLLTLTGATSRSHTDDAVGNQTQINARTSTYNLANRLTKLADGATTVATYKLNGLGQRVAKTIGTTTTRYFYDEQGRLVGEYASNGALIQETIWLDDLPIATLRPTGSGTPTPVAVYYVHADHLGTPRAITRPSDDALMWKWDNADPFGANAANQNPAGIGTFVYNPRFPGQQFDVENGTSYNYFRDYDASVGRYQQSDPIGLSGGLNSYGYAAASPLGLIDPFGTETLTSPESPIRVPGFPNPIDVFFPVTPANDAFVEVTLGIINKVIDACRPDPCGQAIAEAKRRYTKLKDRINVYGSSPTPDRGHFKSIREAKTALQDSIRKVKYYCKPPPQELEEWERAVNEPVPARHR